MEYILGSLNRYAVARYGGVRAHCPLQIVRQASKALGHHGADAIIAVGGGSAIVTARAAAVIYSEGDDISNLRTRRTSNGFLFSPKLRQPKLPVIAVATTPTTALCATGSAITEAGFEGRHSVFDPKTRASAILVDPIAMNTAPPELIRNAAINAFAMAVEGMTTTRAQSISDASLSHAIGLFVDQLPKLRGDLRDSTLRTDIALTSILAGDGTETSGVGLTAALSHTIGHIFALHNGLLDAILLPYVLAHISPVASSQFERIASSMNCEPTDLVGKVGHFLRSLSAPQRLSDLDIPRHTLNGLAREAMNDFAFSNSVGTVDEGQVLAILHAAW